VHIVSNRGTVSNKKCGDFHPAVGLKRVTGGIAYPENTYLRRKMPSFQPKTIF